MTIKRPIQNHCHGRFAAPSAKCLAGILLLTAASLPALPAAAQAPAPWHDDAPMAATPAPAGAAPAADAAPAQQRVNPNTNLHPGESLHLLQKAWEEPAKHMGPGQSQPAYRKLPWTPSAILAINIREGLISTISWPHDENVVRVMVSDPNSFEAVTSPDKHSIAIKPVYPGVDGNVVVDGSSGNIYQIYLQSSPYDASKLPDLKVAVEVPTMAGDTIPYPSNGHYAANGGPGAGGSTAPGAHPDDPSLELTTPRAANVRIGQDYAAVSRTGPGRLRTDLHIFVASEQDSIIAPVAAWRDDKFTYLDFGPRAASMNTWPVASLVVDHVESPVGTRVAGPNRSIMIVESLGDIILRNGQHIVCIKLAAENEDPRHPKDDEPYRDRPGYIPTAPSIENNPGLTRVNAHAPADNVRIRMAANGDHPEAILPAPQGGGNGLRAVTGPYSLDKALALASDIHKGYRGQVPESAISIVAPDGHNMSADEIKQAPNSAAYTLSISVQSDSQGQQICKDLRYSHRTCRLD